MPREDFKDLEVPRFQIDLEESRCIAGDDSSYLGSIENSEMKEFQAMPTQGYLNRDRKALISRIMLR